MHTTRTLGVWACLLVGLLGASGLRAAEVAPELPIAASHGGTVALEDFKGQVTALIFYNDDKS